LSDPPLVRATGTHSSGKPDSWGLLVHPRQAQGQQPPSPMVLIGSAQQSRRAARSEKRRSQRRPTRAFAHATRFVLVGGAARGELLVRRRRDIRRCRVAPALRQVFNAQHTGNPLGERSVSVARESTIVCKASLASLRATARLKSRSNQLSSLVDTSYRHRYHVNPGCRTVINRR